MVKNFLNKLKKNNSIQPKGFTVVEALIAVAVTSIGLVAILGVTVYALSISRVSPDEVIAANLAQEGAEVIRNIRDTNLLEGVEWKANIWTGPGWQRMLLNSTSTGSDLIIMAAPQAGGSALECTTKDDGNNCRLYIDSNGFYSHDSSGQPTNFHRLVSTLYMHHPVFQERRHVRIRSSVAWQDRQGNWREIIVKNEVRQYGLDDVGSEVKWFGWEPSGTTTPCIHDLWREDDTGNCNPQPGGEYHQHRKCGRCCLTVACDNAGYNEDNPRNGSFIYLAPFDDNAQEEVVKANMPAFYGDPVQVCDIVNGNQCRIFVKVEK